MRIGLGFLYGLLKKIFCFGLGFMDGWGKVSSAFVKG